MNPVLRSGGGGGRRTPWRGLFALWLLLVSACSAVEGTPTSPELVLWHAYRGEERAALEAGVTAWAQRHPEVRVRALAVPYDAFVDKVSLAVPKGNGPDVFIFGHDRLGDWAQRGLLEPLGFLADEALLDRHPRETLDALVYADELYGLPLAFKCLALYYDRTLVPEAPATTDELERVARAVRARNPEAWGIAWELDSLYFHAPWLHGFGGAVYADAADTLALGTPEAARSLAFVRAWRTEATIIPPEVTSALTTALFRRHELAFVVSGPWFRAELAGHEGWGVAPLPVVSATGQPARPFLGVEGLFLNRRSRQKSLAFDLMVELTGDVAARTRFRQGGQLVANQAVYEDADVRADTFAQAFRAQAARTVALSNRPHMRRVWTPVKDALSAAIVHGAEPGGVLQKAVDEIGRIDR
jgi:maltose-binding protein MalE